MRRCSLHRAGFRVPSGEELESQIILSRFRRNRGDGKSRGWLPRAVTASRLQAWVAVGGILLGAAVFIGPWLVDEYREMLGYKFVPVSPSAMPHTSPAWWENEWRKGNPLWRAGESTGEFYRGPFDFVRAATGRDMYDGDAFKKGRGAGRRPRALVPLCGDSPIVPELAGRGFEVDAVDASETAMRACVERAERALPHDAYDRVHLHWRDIFAPELWTGPLRGVKFDVIYERQAMTSLNCEQREDYAYLLKQALAEDGVMYVEGVFRTGRVRGNTVRGPPFALSRRELQHLFPESDGFMVRCEETNDAMTKLSRENRILQRIPKELYVTPFHCAVFRAKAVDAAAVTPP
ncbi:thiopurine S-methyltransferase [Trypanosoma conorhini]|uniref:Thiopurine S-methyltransferase n=1 Tax=Trypanosoma conorhini TaxID=83891 RepID=A0A3R7PXN8_9TRYP|nr:thiopurine S-methyltransferase [Trypanosoma conorhini]RNF26818.1 thiopurine S-methyltransferase [Trypanosoma conorhini]